MIYTERSQLRKSIRQKCLQLTMQERQKASYQIIQQLIEHPILQTSQMIAGYLSIDGEVDIKTWFEYAWQQSKQCYLPIVQGKELLFGHYHENSMLIKNQWGILEPDTEHLLSPSALEAVIVPGIAFDLKGHRLGRGAGYYDRSFSFLKKKPKAKQPYLIGIGYTFQILSKLTPAEWDVPLDGVISEKNSN